ncbi:MAG: DUF3108 domain-containing protein [Ignavibacteria bacterium]|jgi:hypothetical protein|nr:DUF3108 domain-containing protein [Ignavibacteria bacterium]
MKTYIVTILFLLMCLNVEDSFSQDKVMDVGEELNYVVYYGFIKLGEVNMKITNKSVEGGKEIYTSKSRMFSYKGIPFVDLEIEFESEIVMDGNDLYSRKFKAREKAEDGYVDIEYVFHYDSQYVYVKKTNKGNVEIDKNISINKNVRFQDGLSLFYRARINSFTPEDNFMIPVFMNEQETSVDYFFKSENEDISLSAFEDDIEAVSCSGVAKFTGVFGMNGEFAGWFTKNPVRIPLKAQLNAIVGSITLELDSYKRPDWKP